MSNFFICRKAFINCADFLASGSTIIDNSTIGTTRQESPYLSLSQPQDPSCPPSVSLLQK